LKDLAKSIADDVNIPTSDEVLHISDLKFRVLCENMQEAYASATLDGRILEFNQAFKDLLGYSETELKEFTYQGLTPPRWHAAEAQIISEQVLNRGYSDIYEKEYLRKDGIPVSVELRTYLMKDATGKPAVLWTIIRDIADRKRKERTLRLMQFAVDHFADLVFQVTPDARLVYVNEAACRRLGYSYAELTQMRIHDLDPDFPPERWAAHWQEFRDNGTLRFETAHRTKRGEVFPVEVNANHVEFDGYECVVSFIRDLSDQKRAEKELRISEGNLAAAQRIAHLGSWETHLHNLSDLDQNPLRWSDEVFRIFGYEPGQVPVTRRTFLQAVPPEDRAGIQTAIETAIREHQPYQLEHRILRPDGSTRMVREQGEVCYDSKTGRPLKIEGTVQDITEHKLLEDKLRQSQKMESFGLLAGGVAHDFNNILSAIVMNADFLSQQPGMDAESTESVRQITDAAQRAAHLTRQLLTFSRKQPIRRQYLDLNEVVGNLAKMLRRIIGEDVALQCHFSSEPLPVYADAGMLEQVLMNLAVNARDAMPHGGDLILTLGQIESDSASRPVDLRATDYVCLSVRDTGCGIAPEHLSFIFEPFYTTKDVGKGTGLGLATVYGVVQQHEGSIEVESKLGEGTVFRVYLPIAEVPPDSQSSNASVSKLPVGSEPILVVEDEAAVRSLIVKCLRRLGYQVTEARNGKEALSLWPQCREQIELLLTDLVMPAGVNGLELAGRLSADKPNLKIIYISGYSADIVTEENVRPNVPCLAKPFTPAELAKTVRACLDQH
jgi:PAS domain S-box-containing protein